VATKKSHRSPKQPQRVESEPVPASDNSLPTDGALPEESASLACWDQQLQELLAAGETPESAAAILAGNINRSFSAWAAMEISEAAALTGQERIDRLVLAGSKIEEGAATIYEHLGLTGGCAIEVAADAIDAIAAEIQYADAAPDHATRIALLRLIRERDRRTFEIAAMTDDSARSEAMRELEAWYESGMRALPGVRFPDA
jgi:hypothetical protein